MLVHAGPENVKLNKTILDAFVSTQVGSHRSRPRVADKADVEHELIPRVLFVLQDDGVTHHFVALDVGGHDALHELCFGNDVGADIPEGLFRDDDLVPGRLEAIV